MPDDQQTLIELLTEIDSELPICINDDYQIKVYARPDDLLRPRADGLLVVISRGVLRRILRELKDVKASE